MQSRENAQKSRLETQRQKQQEQQNLIRQGAQNRNQQSQQLQPQTAPLLQLQNLQRSLKQNQLKTQQQQPKYQLSDTMKENVLDDFISIRIGSDLKQLEYGLKDTMPKFFFTLIYSAVSVSPKEYENIISKNFAINDSNAELIASIARKINTTLRCSDFEVLKALEPYKYLEKIQPPKNAEEEREAVQQIQAILRSQYLALVEQIDIGGKYYDKLVKNGRIKASHGGATNGHKTRSGLSYNSRR